MIVGINAVCDALNQNDNIWILSHASPDGDTLGSAFGLYWGLKSIGKKARVICADVFPERYSFLYEDYIDEEFEPDYIVSVDLASEQLFGKNMMHLTKKIDLSIDHHPSNTFYAKNTYLQIRAATAELIYDILDNMNIKFDNRISSAIYTGISTDTGCFKFANTTWESHEISAKLIRFGADYKLINELMFENKSSKRIAIESYVYNNIEYHFDGKCAVIFVPLSLLNEVGANEYDAEGLSSFPRQIEGVEIGITINEKSSQLSKISMRSRDSINASEIAAKFSGGGHARAAGCAINADMFTARDMIIEELKDVFC